MSTGTAVWISIACAACGRIGFDPVGTPIGDPVIRRDVTIDHTAITEALSDVPVCVSLDAAFDYADALADGSDLRFVDVDGAPLAHEVESWQPGGRSALWVRVPLLPAGERTVIRLEYGDGVSAAATPAVVWSNGFSAVWHLSDRIAGLVSPVIRDSTAFGNHGHPRAGVGGLMTLESDDSIDGMIGQALELGDDPNDTTSSPDLILVPDSDSLDLTGASVTISAWVAIEIDDVELIVMKSIDAYPLYQPRYAEWGLAWNLGGFPTDQRLCWFANAGGVDPLCGAVGSMPLVTSAVAWHHVAVTFGGSPRVVSWYLDGRRVETIPSTQPDISDTTHMPVIIGGPSTNTEVFHGRLDELEIAGVPRSAEWIHASYVDATGAVTIGPPL